MANLSKGTIVDNYMITRVLNPGGFACAYFVKDIHNQTGEEHFLKELFPSDIVCRVGNEVRLSDAKYADQWNICKEGFQQELHALSQLSVPHIPKILDAFSENNTLYIVQEKVEGVTLDKWFKHKVVNKGFEANLLMVKMLVELLLTVDGLHSAHKLHRDIKPSNILVDDFDNPYLIDFGAVRFEVDTVTHNIERRAFTPGFASLEQSTAEESKQQKQGFYSDIYSVGATFHYLLFGKIPVSAMRRMVKGEKVESFLGFKDTYNKTFLKSLDKAFQLMPISRYQSAKEWLADLQPVVQELGIEIDTGSTVPRYQFNVGSIPANNANETRLVLNQSSYMSKLHAEFEVVCVADDQIEITVTDRSTNGTAIVESGLEGETTNKLERDVTVTFDYSTALTIQFADLKMSLKELLLQFVEETRANQLKVCLDNIESGQKTQVMSNNPLESMPQKSPDAISIDDDIPEPFDEPQHIAPMTPLQYMFSFKGTINRLEFWLCICVLIVVPTFISGILFLFGAFTTAGLASMVDDVESVSAVGGGLLILCFGIVSLLNVWAVKAVYYKRLKSTGMKSSKAITLMILPYVFAVFGVVIPAMIFISIIIWVIMFIMAGFVKGDTFQNGY